MADPLSFDALASSEHVLSSAENFVLYVLLEAVARGAGGPGGGSRLPLNLGVVIDVRRAPPGIRGRSGQIFGRQPDCRRQDFYRRVRRQGQGADYARGGARQERD